MSIERELMIIEIKNLFGSEHYITNDFEKLCEILSDNVANNNALYALIKTYQTSPTQSFHIFKEYEEN